MSLIITVAQTADHFRDLVEIRKASYNNLSNEWSGLSEPLKTLLRSDAVAQAENPEEGYVHFLAYKNEKIIGCVSAHLPADFRSVHSSRLFSGFTFNESKKNAEILKLFVLDYRKNRLAAYHLMISAYVHLVTHKTDNIYLNFFPYNLTFYRKLGNIVSQKEIHGMECYLMELDPDFLESRFSSLIARSIECEITLPEPGF